MKQTFHLPDVGEGIAEAAIVTIRVHINQTITPDDILWDIDTDKSIVESPAPFSGRIAAIHISEGDIISVGQALFDIQSNTDQQPIAGSLSEHQFSAPMPVERPDLTINTPQHHWMTQSWRHIPHTYIFETIETIQKPRSITEKCIMACQQALSKHPKMNQICLNMNLMDAHKEVVGCAIYHDEKTYVINIIKNNEHTEDEIKHIIKDAQSELSSTGHLKQNKDDKPAIIVSNIGNICGEFATPLIYPPATMMLAVGRMNIQFLPDADNKPQPHYCLPISFAFNHLMAQGAESAAFLGSIKDALINMIE